MHQPLRRFLGLDTVLSVVTSAAMWAAAATAVAQPGGCGDPGSGSCYSPQPNPGCSQADCCDSVCGFDPFCCAVAWDPACVDSATFSCVPCPVCFGGAVAESEPCGASWNPGCDGGIFHPGFFGFELECETTVCGTLWADAGQVDSDWYWVVLPDPDGDGVTPVGLSFGVNLPAAVEVYTGFACAALTLQWSLTLPPCDGISIPDVCLPAGLNLFRIVPTVSTGYPCSAVVPPEYAIAINYCGLSCDCDGDGIPDSAELDKDFDLIPDDCDACFHLCPSGSTDEGETCGQSMNDGCNGGPQLFGSISCGETICGTAWADGGDRDSDWFEIDLGSPQYLPCDIVVSIHAEFPAVIGVIDGNAGCIGAPFVAVANAPACAVTSLSVPHFGGTYWVFVAPDAFSGYPCSGPDVDYTITLTCGCSDCDEDSVPDSQEADPFCCHCICMHDSFCCSTSWDPICAAAAALACDKDCNGNGTMDTLDVILGASRDCNENCRPDECDPYCAWIGTPPGGYCAPAGCNLDFDCCTCVAMVDAFCCQVQWDDLCAGIASDICEKDCNGNGVFDTSDVLNGTSEDCNHNCIPDECEVGVGPPPLAVSANQNVCVGDTVSLDASTPVPPADVAWYSGPCPAQGSSVGVGYAYSPSTAFAGTYVYSVVATDPNTGCVSCEDVTVTIAPAPAVPTNATATPSTICLGGSSTLSASVGAGETVVWHAGSCTGPVVPGGASPTVSPTTTTTYYGSAMNSATMCVSTSCATVTVTVSPLPVAPTSASSNPQSYCAGTAGTITLTTVGGSGTTLEWFDGSCGGTPVGTGNNLVLPKPTTTKTYYARWTTPTCGSSACAQTTVTVNPLPVAPTSASSNPQSYCAGTAGNITLTAVGGSGTTLEWFDGSCGGTPVGTGNNLVLPKPTTTKTYFARWTTPTCGSSACAQTTVTVNPLPVAPTSASSNPQSYCEGTAGTITLTAVGGSGTTLEWFDGSCGGTPVGTGNNLVLAKPTTTKTYYARWTTPTCGSSACAQTTVTVNPLPAVPAPTASPATICAGASSTLSVAPVAGTTFDWFTGSCGGTPAGTGTSITVSPTTTTTYYVRATNGCGTSACATVTVTVNPLPVAPTSASSSPQSYCAGTAGNITLTAVGGSGTTLEWFDGSCGGTPVGTGNNLVLAKPTTTKTYYARWTTPTCGSSACAQTTVTVNPLPVAPTSASSNPQSYCEGTAGTITLTAVGGSGTTLEWFDGSCGGTPVGTGNNLVLPKPTTTKTYFARWTTPTCGSSACAQTMVTVNPLPAVPAPTASPATICAGASSTLSVAPVAGTTFEWFTGSCGGTPAGTGTSITVSPTSTTTYYVRATNSATLCVSTTCAMVTVTVLPQPGCASIENPGGGAVAIGNFVIDGLPDGKKFSWQIRTPCPVGGGDMVVLEELLAPGLTSGTPVDLADHFATRIYLAACASGCEVKLSKTDTTGQFVFKPFPCGPPPPGTTCPDQVACPPLGAADVKLAQAGTGNKAMFTFRVSLPTWSLWVRDESVTNAPWCKVQFSPACQFNPQIYLLPLADADCNGNGEDDSVDLFTGTSLDLDENGVPDECDVPSCLRSTASCFIAHEGPGCASSSCCVAVCSVLPVCCTDAWDSGCAALALELCAEPGPCDLADHTCVEQGGPGCSGIACCLMVCGVDPACCEVAWDDLCVGQAIEECGKKAPCPDSNHACDTAGDPGCTDEACCADVCIADPFCCQVAWDQICVFEAAELCAAAGDLNGDGVVDGGDLGLLLGNWGTAGPGDLDGNGVVDGGDLGLLLGLWTPVPQPVLGGLDGDAAGDTADTSHPADAADTADLGLRQATSSQGQTRPMRTLPN